MTTVSIKQMAAAKRIAANVLPLTNKKARLTAKIKEMEAEIEILNHQIDAQQGYVKEITNGLTTEDLLVRVDNRFVPNNKVVTWDENQKAFVFLVHTEAPSDDNQYPVGTFAEEEEEPAVENTQPSVEIEEEVEQVDEAEEEYVDDDPFNEEL